MLDAAPETPYTGLVVRAGQGDRRATEALCARFVPVVRAFARRRLRSRDAVEELTQDVMLLLVEALQNRALEDPARLPGFVLGICHNLARDRARQRERRAALWQKYGAVVAELVTEQPEAPTYEVIHLEDCLASLSRRARDVIRLSFAETASPAEIARALSISEGNVRVLRHRSLASLRECLSKRMSWEAA